MSQFGRIHHVVVFPLFMILTLFSTLTTAATTTHKDKVQNPKVQNKSWTTSHFVLGSKIVQLKISGNLNQAILNVSDGASNNTFITTNDNHLSRVKLTGTVKISTDLTVGGLVSIGLKANPSDQISQVTQSVGDTLDIRQANIFIVSKRFGKLSLGKGNTASDTTAEADLSGTKDADYSAIQKVGGSLFFTSPGVAIASNPQVGNALNNLDGFSRKNRLRYDSPSLYGFSLSGSLIAAKRNDIALRFSKKIAKTKVKAAIAYTSPQTLNTDRGNFLDGSLSALLPNGLSVTVAGGMIRVKQAAGRIFPHYYYVKPGYQAKLNCLGKTAFSANYGRFDDFIQNGDKATVYGAQLEQYVTAWQFAFYIGYRNISLRRPSTQFGHINMVLVGGRLNFG